MANPVQWAIDQAFAAFRKIAADADQEGKRISMANARIIALNSHAGEIADPTARAQFVAWVKKAAANQGAIANRWRLLQGNVVKLTKAISDWLRAHGINPSGSGLGAVPLLVPAAIVALITAAIAAVAIIRSNNDAAVKQIEYREQALHALTAGGASPDQLAKFIADAERAAAQDKKPSDPLGVTGLVEALTPLALIIGAVVLVPPILRMARRSNPLRRRRRRRAFRGRRRAYA